LFRRRCVELLADHDEITLAQRIIDDAVETDGNLQFQLAGDGLRDFRLTLQECLLVLGWRWVAMLHAAAAIRSTSKQRW
jgi:hypothetical protein